MSITTQAQHNNTSNCEAHQIAAISINTLFAQPYSLDAAGFYFDSMEAYATQSQSILDAHDQQVEEFEIQFIDGHDAQLFEACAINQSNLDVWFDEVEALNDHNKVVLYYLCSCIGYQLDSALQMLDDVCLSPCKLKDAADELFDEIYLHEIPEAVRCYIDYESFARDCELNGDMTEFEYNSDTWTCTNAACI